jgi:hypothetical protein
MHSNINRNYLTIEIRDLNRRGIIPWYIGAI